MRFFKRNFGVEIEACGGTGWETEVALNKLGLGKHWDFTEDGSVRESNADKNLTITANEGTVELASKIFEPTAKSLLQIEKTTKALLNKGYYVNESCGTHVHINAINEKPQTILCAVYLYGLLEPELFDRIVPSSRRKNKNHYCGSLTSTPIKAFLRLNTPHKNNIYSNITNNTNLGHDWNYRNKNINLQSLIKHGTIEFRQFGGTLNHIDLNNWITLLQFFFNYCSWISNPSNFKPEFELIKQLQSNKRKRKLTVNGAIKTLSKPRFNKLFSNIEFLDYRVAGESRSGSIVKCIEQTFPASQFFKGIGLGDFVRDKAVIAHFFETLKKELPSIHGWALERSESLFSK